MAGIGVQPVEGRLDAMRLDGDPAALTPGVLDGDICTFAVLIALPLIQMRRTPPSQLVRQTSETRMRRTPPTQFTRRP